VLYLYAFAERPVRLPDVVGLEGSALSAEEVDGVTAVVSAFSRESVRPTEEAVLTHARVVDALVDLNEAVVPARFGRAFADSERLRRATAGRFDVLRDALQKVHGCVELGLRAVPPPAGATGEAPSTGREYLRSRLADQQRIEQLGDDLHAPLAALARASTGMQTTPQLLSAAYLVPRGRTDDFRRAVRELEARHPGVALVCTGPWPPYSFATSDPAGS
jgi:glycosyltransferase involved in cell wall biosynthesis